MSELDFMKERKLSKQELKQGIRVYVPQLSNIYDTYIVLTNVKLVKDKFVCAEFGGIIGYFSTEPLSLTQDNSTLVYNSSLGDDVYVVI